MQSSSRFKTSFRAASLLNIKVLLSFERSGNTHLIISQKVWNFRDFLLKTSSIVS